nr:MAG TPA: hypothetical protein [Bacteriophage sp.]
MCILFLGFLERKEIALELKKHLYISIYIDI